MRKEAKLIFISVSLILILSMSFVSASWFTDFFNKLFGGEAEITGRPVEGGFCECFNEQVLTDDCDEGYSPFGCEEGCGFCDCKILDCGFGDCCHLEEPCHPSYGTLVLAGRICYNTEVEPIGPEYTCGGVDPETNGACGSSIMQRNGTKRRECSGISEVCPTTPNGGYIEYWGEWELNESCGEFQKCTYVETADIKYHCWDDDACLVCGNGVVDSGEECDDGPGTPVDGDGCNSTCGVEAGWGCEGIPSVCTELCGNGVIDGEEACDDGNDASGDGCSSCSVESGWECNNLAPPSVCTELCGNDVRDTGEQCDDGGKVSGDGCSSICGLEAGWECDEATPNVCTELCGNGVINGAEECDDGNDASGDGCSSACSLENHYVCPTVNVSCTDCDVDGDGHDSTSTTCASLSGDDCDDTDSNINPGISESEYCEDEIDNDCDGMVDTDDGDCDPDCLDADSDGYSNETCGGSDCDDSNPNIHPGADENCTSEVDYDCDGESFNGCVFHYYSIDELIVSTSKVAQNSEISVGCFFEIKDSATSGSRVSEVDVSESCIRASINANFSKCEFILDDQNNEGLYYRAFKCHVGAVSAVDKSVRCAVNTLVCSALPVSSGGHPSSEKAKITVTTVDFDFGEQKKHQVTGLLGEIKKFALEGGATHTLEILLVFSSSIKLTISSDPINVTLNTGNSVEVDINGDGIEDIEITLISIIDGKTILDIEALETSDECDEGVIRACGTNYDGRQFCANNVWSVCSYDSVGGSDDVLDTGPDAGEDGGNIWIYVLIIIIFLLLVIVAIFFMKKRLSKMSGPTNRPIKGPPQRSSLPRGPPPRSPPPRSPPPRKY